jgi:hypothetical protein
VINTYTAAIKFILNLMTSPEGRAFLDQRHLTVRDSFHRVSLRAIDRSIGPKLVVLRLACPGSADWVLQLALSENQRFTAQLALAYLASVLDPKCPLFNRALSKAQLANDGDSQAQGTGGGHGKANLSASSSSSGGAAASASGSAADESEIAARVEKAVLARLSGMNLGSGVGAPTMPAAPAALPQGFHPHMGMMPGMYPMGFAGYGAHSPFPYGYNMPGAAYHRAAAPPPSGDGRSADQRDSHALATAGSSNADWPEFHYDQSGTSGP